MVEKCPWLLSKNAHGCEGIRAFCSGGRINRIVNYRGEGRKVEQLSVESFSLASFALENNDKITGVRALLGNN